jgi:hypothetical protein
LWLRLGRLDRTRLRAALFVPLSALLWLVHAFGWGTLGVLAFSAELVRQYDRGRNIFAAAFFSGVHCLALAPPIILVLLWRSEAAGSTRDWFNWKRKWDWLTMALRDRWEMFDLFSLGLVCAVLLFALFSRRLTYSRNLAASVIFLSLVFVLLPRIVFGSAYADMRLAPYLFAIALIAIRFSDRTGARFVALFGAAGIVFFAARTAATTASMWLYDRSFDRELAALDHVPAGARMVSFVGRGCVEPWSMSRLLHLPGLAISRRRAFSNDQWSIAGAQLLTVRYGPGAPFLRDPSQVVTIRPCRRESWRTIDQALVSVPRTGFDYVWLIHPPPHDPVLTNGLKPVWRSGPSVLYRVVDQSPPVIAPEGS